MVKVFCINTGSWGPCMWGHEGSFEEPSWEVERCHGLVGGTASQKAVAGEGLLKVTLVAILLLLSIACRQALLSAGGRSSPPLAGVLSHSNSRKEGGTACFRALYLLLPTAALPRLNCVHGDQGQGCCLCSCPWWPGYPLYSSLR